MTTTIPTYPAGLFHEASLASPPNSTAVPPLWIDFTPRARFAAGTQRGRQYETDSNPAGSLTTSWWNRDGALDPLNAASPYWPNIVPYRGTRIRGMPGANQLTGNQATACEGTGFTGLVPSWLGVGNDAGFPVSVAASGSAYQGANVYSSVVPSGQGAGVTVLLVTSVPVVPNAAYSFSAQVRIPSGTSTATSLQVVWFDQNGNQLSTVAGTAATPTSGSATWIALGASGTAPRSALSASLRVQIDSGSTAAPTTWQADGLQWENSATVTPFQVPQALSANLLPRQIATGTASMAVSDSASNWFAPIIGSVAQAANLTAAPSGQTTAVAWTSPVGTTSASPLYAGVVAGGAPSSAGPVADCVQVTAAQQYTASVYLMRAASADATVQATVSIVWFSATGAVLSTATGSAATVAAGSWVRATAAAATAPAGAVWGRVRIQITTPATTTAINTLYAAGWQFEQAGSASAWTDPGPTLFAYTGMVERWPQGWQAAGSYGRIDVTGVDAEAALAQYVLQAPFVEEVLNYSPNFLYQLNDPSGSTSCADTAGKRLPAPVENSPFGVGSLVFGSSVTSTNPGQAFLGTPGPVATFNNPLSGSNVQKNETYISINKTAAVVGPPQTGSWSRMVAFRTSVVPGGTNVMSVWTAYPSSWDATNQSSFWVQVNAAGQIWLNCVDLLNRGQTYVGSVSIADGNWHQAAIVVDGANQQVALYVDGVQVALDVAAARYPAGLTSDVIGCAYQNGLSIYEQGYQGDVAHAIELPVALTAAQVTNLYNSFRTASSGESSGARVRRILSWVPWNGPLAIDNGSTTSMGPATDATGNSALVACQNAATTENGNFYVSSAGAVTFKSRASRYNQTVPAYVFGEKKNLGEWPYEDTTFGDDPTRLYNIIPIAQFSSGQTVTAQDAASQTAYFPRTMPTRTLNVSSINEAVDASNYLLGQYKVPRVRVANLLLHPTGVNGLFNVCLNLEIGTRIRVMRRSGAVVDQIDCFIEQITWYIDPTPGAGGKATVKLQCSPADLASYWLVAATRTTLNAQAASGQAQATINALPDAAVNALSSSLPQQYQLVFEPGTARQETMTLAVGGIPATTVGYQSATLTFTTNFGFTHAAGTTVCEPLPAGVTDPTVYDAAAVLGASSCQVLSGGGTGTNTITVGPLPDSKTNGLGSDWNTGDLLAVSPGTANYEGYNTLHPNLSTAGEGVLPLTAGTAGSTVGVTSALGTLAVTASGTAQQGANVWQAPIPGAASLLRLLRVNLVPAAAGLAHTWSVYVRSVTSGANPTVNPQIVWFDVNGNTLSTVNGGTTVLTGATSAAWTRISVSGTAPAGAAWASLGVPLNATAPAGAWSFQADALQWEQAASASAYCTTPQVLSVAAAVPGYSSVTITLGSNLLNSHAAGDTVCDALPPGVTAPPAGSMRFAY